MSLDRSRKDERNCEIKEQIEKAQLIKTRTGIDHDIQAANDREVKMAVFNFMKEMPPSLRDACLEFIREKAKTEQSIATGGTEDAIEASANS